MPLLFEIDVANNQSWNSQDLFALGFKGLRNSSASGQGAPFTAVSRQPSSDSLAIVPIVTGQEHRGGALTFQGNDYSILVGSSNIPSPLISEQTLMSWFVWNGIESFDNFLFSTTNDAVSPKSQGFHVYVPANTSDLRIEYVLDDGTLGGLTLPNYLFETEYNWQSIALAVEFQNKYLAVYRNGDFHSDYVFGSFKIDESLTYRRCAIGAKYDTSDNSGMTGSSNFDIQSLISWSESLSADDILANHESRAYRYREVEIVLSHLNSSELLIAFGGFTPKQLKAKYVDGFEEDFQQESTVIFSRTFATPQFGITRLYGQFSNIVTVECNTTFGQTIPISQTNKFAHLRSLVTLSTFVSNSALEYDFVYLTTHKTDDWRRIKIDARGRNFDVSNLGKLTNITELLLGFAGTGGNKILGTFNEYPPLIQLVQLQACQSVGFVPNLLWPNSMFNLTISGYLDQSYDLTTIVRKQDGTAIRRVSFSDLVGQAPTTAVSGNLTDYPSLLDFDWFMFIQCENTLTGDFAAFLNRSYTRMSNCTIEGQNTLSGDLSTIDWTGKQISDAIVIGGQNTITGLMTTGLEKFPNCQTLSFSGQNTLTGDLAAFSNANTVVLRGNNQVNNYTSGTAWRSGTKAVVIKGLQSSANNFSTTDTDAILNDIWSAVNGANNDGTIDIYSLGRTAASDAAHSGLISQGWTIILTQNV